MAKTKEKEVLEEVKQESKYWYFKSKIYDTMGKL